MTAAPWTPEREVDVFEAVAAIGTTDYPGAVDGARIVAAGWDNTIVEVDGDMYFRLPRRALALPGIERELVWLEQIAPRVEAPIPVPLHRGVWGSPPWPFWGGRALPGTELAHHPDLDRVPVARAVGHFLRALHAIDPVDLGPPLPVDPMGRAHAPVRAARAREGLHDLECLAMARAEPLALTLLDDAATLGPCVDPPVLSHGDLYARHVLVDDRGELAGIIDWGDLCLAPPPVDLCVAYSAFDGPARDAFFEAYGDHGTESEIRARVMALFSATQVALYARDVGDPVLEAESLLAISRSVRGYRAR